MIFYYVTVIVPSEGITICERFKTMTDAVERATGILAFEDRGVLKRDWAMLRDGKSLPLGVDGFISIETVEDANA